MCIHKLELNFSDFREYSCISETNFLKKKRIKISVNVLDLPVVLILKIDSFPIIPSTAGGKPIRFQKFNKDLICVISMPLHR